MLEGINIVAVAGTTFFMMASATVWFSPFMFGRVWLHELKVSESEIEASRQDMTLHLGMTALCYAAALGVLAHVVSQVNYLQASNSYVILAMTILVVAILGNTSLWENRSRVYFLVNAGFYAYFVIVGMLMIQYWPW